MKRNIKPFGNDIVRLRLIEEKDLETTLSWRNRDEARIWFKSTSTISLDQHREWFQRYQEKDNDFLFVIEVNNKLVGQASVYDIDWDAGQAEVGRFLAAPDEGSKGYIGQACAALIHLCTDTLSLKYIFLEVIENNERAVRLYQHNGFIEEQRYDGLIRMSLSFELKETV